MILKKYKDFSHVFLGRLISNCGDSIYTIVLSWYVLEMTNSAWYVGLLNFLIFIPNTFSFVFGKKIDSHPKKILLVLLEWAQLLAVLG
ncbi:MAG: MFS transporter, partial [Streptococcus equinus]|nr:MFS transporter [Streptococcus equinus]